MTPQPGTTAIVTFYRPGSDEPEMTMLTKDPASILALFALCDDELGMHETEPTPPGWERKVAPPAPQAQFRPNTASTTA